MMLQMVLLLGVRLPLVDGAVTAGEGVGLGILKGVQDGLVLAVEGNAAKKRKIILWQILFRQVAWRATGLIQG